jgi:penicillin amidase
MVVARVFMVQGGLPTRRDNNTLPAQPHFNAFPHPIIQSGALSMKMRPHAPQVFGTMAAGLLIAGGLTLAGCHPLAIFHPKKMPDGAPLSVAVDGGTHLSDRVRVLLDDQGVPHIHGNSDSDIAYGLGFMHARDRLFQLDLLRHAANGRLSELFGEDLLEVDHRLRLLTWDIERQWEGLSDKDKAIVEAYAAGINAGADHVGRAAQMVILGIDFEPYTALDSLASVRLQAWDLAGDFEDELWRDKVKHALGDDAKGALLTAMVPSKGVPIVSVDEDASATNRSFEPEGQAIPAAGAMEKAALLPTDKVVSDVRLAHAASSSQKPVNPLSREIRDWVEHGHFGASNSWVVSGQHTQSGHPILCNDPHLAHRAPGVFYLAHLEHPDFSVAGATFPGVPAVLIGTTRHLAWGMTTSYGDGQDLVRIQIDPKDENRYIVDGKSLPFATHEETFQVGKGTGDAVQVKKETWRSTIFGPILPEAWAKRGAEGSTYALMWTGYVAGGKNANIVTAFYDLARAKNPVQATAAVDKMQVAGQNVSLAFTNGNIAYRLGTYLPVRASGESTHFPRDGSSIQAGWRGFVPSANKPQLTNPKRGYFVTANQRVVDDDHRLVAQAGSNGATPHRAMRIHDRVKEAIGVGKVTADDLLNIQQDILSAEARAISQVLAAHCEKGTPLCDALANWDFRYEKGSQSPLAFTRLYKHLRIQVLLPLLGEEMAPDIAKKNAVNMVFETELAKIQDGQSSALIGDADALRGLLKKANQAAEAELKEEVGEDPDQWIWGAVHTLTFKGPLAAAPGLGMLFQTNTRPEDGHRRTVRAEGGEPITHGAAFRMVTELGPTPHVRMVTDFGNSGHPGHRHWGDQTADWSAGAPRVMPMRLKHLRPHIRGSLVLIPKKK